MKKWLNACLYGIMAGILISIGGSVFLACANKYVGSVLFCIALICICYKGYYLFTGKVGFIPESHGKDDWINLVMCLAGNAIGTLLVGEMLRFCIPAYHETAYAICSAKLTLNFWQWLGKGVMCGILMYLAVSIYKENNKNIVGILFCIPTFILSGFEHSIADMYYFAVSGIATWKAVGFLMTIVLGNAIGGVLLPLMKMLIDKKPKEEKINDETTEG